MRLLPLLALALAFAACNPPCQVAESGTAVSSSTITVDYVGTLNDGTEFDSGSCVEFSLLRVVPGFREGITGMNVGDEKTFSFGPDKGYGNNPPPGIPAGADLTFEVKLYQVR